MDRSPLATLRDGVLRSDLSSFIGRSFATVNPGTKYLPNWHIDLIAEYLEACRRAEITRLIINLPPRALKSLSVSVAWPAYLLGHEPSTRIIVASYSRALALRHSVDSRLVLQSRWYRRVFPETQLVRGQNTRDLFVTEARGFRLATSVGGTLTGQGGTVLIVDDPHKPSEMLSTVRRQAVKHWYDHTFASRLDDKHRGAIVVVMQRLHPDDLTGYLLEKSPRGWEHLLIPALAEEARMFSFGRVAKTMLPGEALHATREDAHLLRRAREELGMQAFAAQYLQRPVPQEGALIRPGWLGRYAPHEELPDGLRVQSWDAGVKTGLQHDPSACVTAIAGEKSVDIIDVLAERLAFPELYRRVLAQAEAYRPHALLIEDAASGQALLQQLRHERPDLPAIGIRPRGDKRMRVTAVTPMLETGQVRLPVNAPWLAAFETELYAFPHAPHDDRVDALSQLLHYVREKQRTHARIRPV